MKICLLMAFLFSLSLFSQEKLSYKNEAQALEIARRIEQQYLELSKTDPDIYLSTYHIAGKHIDEHIESILIYLKEHNVPTSSLFISKSDFTRDQEEFIDKIAEDTPKEARAFLVEDAYQKDPKSFRRRLKIKFKNTLDHFFGTPEGISFWRFFTKDGKPFIPLISKDDRRTFPSKEEGKTTYGEKKQRWLTAHTIGSAGIAMTASQAFKQNLLEPIINGLKTADWQLVTASFTALSTWETFAPVLAVALYVAPLGYLTRELSGFKNQGKALNYINQIGEKVEVIKSKLGYYTSTIGVSLFGNAAVLMAIHGANISASDIGNGLLNSFIGNFAKIPFEFALDKLFQRAIKTEEKGKLKIAQGLEEEGRRLLKQAKKKHKVAARLKTIWAWIYGGIKTVHLLAPDLIKARPDLALPVMVIWAGFNGIGVISLFKDVHKYRRTIFNDIVKGVSSFLYGQWDHCARAYLGPKTLFKFSKSSKP